MSFSAAEMNAGRSKCDIKKLLLVGVRYTKVTWKNWYIKKNVPQERKGRIPHTHYVTLLYAFDPAPPFRVQARLGYFCLGHALSGSDSKLPVS